jgi:hypothetical protein
MKKLLVMMVVGFGAAMLVKHGQVTITPDRQIQVVGYNVPLPDAVQNSPIMGYVTTMLMGQLPQASQTASRYPGGAARPMLPMVTSVSGTFNGNASSSSNSAGPVTGAAGFDAATKALRGSQ